MLPAGDQDVVGVGDDPGLDGTVGREFEIAKGDVKVVVLEPVEEVLVGLQRQFEVDARVGLGKDGNELGKQVEAQHLGGADPHPAALEPEITVDLDQRLFDAFEDAHRAGVEEGADLGEGAAAAAAGENLDAELFFELLDLDRNRGLADAQFFGGA